MNESRTNLFVGLLPTKVLPADNLLERWGVKPALVNGTVMYGILIYKTIPINCDHQMNIMDKEWLTPSSRRRRGDARNTFHRPQSTRGNDAPDSLGGGADAARFCERRTTRKCTTAVRRPPR